MTANSDIQTAKENARRLALQLGLALERHNDRIESISVRGERTIVVEGLSDGAIWPAAQKVMEDKLGKKPTAAGLKCENIIAYTDGGSRGNPGPSASGFVLYDASTNKLLEEGGEYLGITTNNQAEYNAVRLALEHSLIYQPNSIDMYLDSLLVVNQLTGVYKIKNRDLLPIHQAIKELIPHFASFRVSHVPREQNTAADNMVNQILDQYKK